MVRNFSLTRNKCQVQLNLLKFLDFFLVYYVAFTLFCFRKQIENVIVLHFSSLHFLNSFFFFQVLILNQAWTWPKNTPKFRLQETRVLFQRSIVSLPFIPTPNHTGLSHITYQIPPSTPLIGSTLLRRVRRNMGFIWVRRMWGIGRPQWRPCRLLLLYLQVSDLFLILFLI